MKKIKINPDSTTPKVRQIEEQIRDQIASGVLTTGEKLPSMRILAKEIEVSVGITKQALNTLTIEGILRSDPKVGVFVSEKKPTKNIALILPTVELEQIARIVQSTRTNLSADYHLIIEAAANDYEDQIQLLKYLHKSQVAGILLVSLPMQRYAESLNENLPEEIPCVQILTELRGVSTDSSTFDGFEMGESAVEHLVQNGHTEIGLVSTDADASTFRDRDQGMDEALKKIGKDYESLPKQIIQADQLSADDPSLLGQQASARLLEEHPGLTAIIGGNGMITLGAIQSIKETGKSIPDDISLISMNLDISPFKHMSPTITSIDQPVEKICRNAVRLLMDRIETPDAPLKSIQFSPILRERESVKNIARPYR